MDLAQTQLQRNNYTTINLTQKQNLVGLMGLLSVDQT